MLGFGTSSQRERVVKSPSLTGPGRPTCLPRPAGATGPWDVDAGRLALLFLPKALVHWFSARTLMRCLMFFF